MTICEIKRNSEPAPSYPSNKYGPRYQPLTFEPSLSGNGQARKQKGFRLRLAAVKHYYSTGVTAQTAAHAEEY
jgi:hypothetical protein